MTRRHPGEYLLKLGVLGEPPQKKTTLLRFPLKLMVV